jgi:hypothetical protein
MGLGGHSVGVVGHGAGDAAIMATSGSFGMGWHCNCDRNSSSHSRGTPLGAN